MSFEYFAWVLLLQFLVVACALTYGIMAWTMGAVAARRMLPSLLVVFVIGAALMSLVLVLPKVLPKVEIVTVAAVMQLVALIVGVPAVIYRRRRGERAGAVLLDLGPLPGHHFYSVFFVLLIVPGLALLGLSLRPGRFEWHGLIHGLFVLAMAGELLLRRRQRVQLREGGLLYGNIVLPWEWIVGYQWEPADPSVVTLRVRSILGFTQRMPFPVPVESIASVEQVLAQHVQAAAP